MWVDVGGEGAGRGGPEVWDELVLGVEGDDRERELLEDGGRWGGRGDNGDRIFNNGGGKVLYRDVREWDSLDNFFELEVDVGVLCFVGGGILELRA